MIYLPPAIGKQAPVIKLTLPLARNAIVSATKLNGPEINKFSSQQNAVKTELINQKTVNSF